MTEPIDKTPQQIVLPEAFTQEHERVLTRYLQDDRGFSTTQWQALYTAIDLLGQAEVLVGDQRYTFRYLYNEYVDQHFADEYLRQLLRLTDLAKQSSALTAQFARQIAPRLMQLGLFSRQVPQSFLLLAYCLYWWQSFARGYAFELEIAHDLEAAAIDFEMHDVRSRIERYSQADLILLGLLGDIKTSPYFLHEQTGEALSNDFYITRLYEQGRARTLVVFQKPPAWARIGGGATIRGRLDNVVQLLPQAVQLEDTGLVLIVVAYEVWKALVQQIQAAEGREGVGHG